MLFTQEAVEDNSVVISIEISFDTTRTVDPAFVIPDSMLAVRALEFPSTSSLC